MPKNLVYIFVGIVVFAFAAMLWITYTERDLKEFLNFKRAKEHAMVDPLFTSLKQSMMAELDKGRPDEMSVDGFNENKFFDEYLSESRPLVVKRQASNWHAA